MAGIAQLDDFYARCINFIFMINQKIYCGGIIVRITVQKVQSLLKLFSLSLREPSPVIAVVVAALVIGYFQNKVWQIVITRSAVSVRGLVFGPCLTLL